MLAEAKRWDCWGLFGYVLSDGSSVPPPALGSFRYVSWALAVWGVWYVAFVSKAFKAASIAVLDTYAVFRSVSFLLSCCTSERLPWPAAVEGDFPLSAPAVK